MKLVLDATFAMSWITQEKEPSPAVAEFSDRFLAGTLELHAPELFLAEMANALWKTVRRGRRTLDDSVAMFANVHDLAIELHGHRDLAASALDLAMRRGIPAASGFYVALAIREGLPLFTADARLASATEDLLDVILA